MVRISNEGIRAEAIRVFGDPDKAEAWLNQINPVLGCSPIDMLSKCNGLDEVMKVLSSIAHGGVV